MINAGFGEEDEVSHTTREVIILSNEKRRRHYEGIFNHLHYPKMFVTGTQKAICDRFNLITNCEPRGPNFLCTVDLGELKSLDESSYLALQQALGTRTLLEKLDQFRFKRGFPLTPLGKELAAVSRQMCQKVLVGIAQCEDPTYIHELEHVLFRQNVNKHYENITLNGTEARFLHTLSETYSLFAGLAYAEKTGNRAFLDFHFANQLRTLALEDDSKPFSDIEEVLLTDLSKAEVHAVSYLIGVYGESICDMYPQSYELLDLKKISALAGGESTKEIAANFYALYAQRLLKDIQGDPAMVYDQIRRVQSDLGSTWQAKLSTMRQRMLEVKTQIGA